jgi:hypothetical protein
MQRRGEQASTTIEGLCFLRGPCRGVILKTIGAIQLVDNNSAQELVNMEAEYVKLKIFHSYKRLLGNGW